LVCSKTGVWAIVAPDGRYDASDPDRIPGVYWLLEREASDPFPPLSIAVFMRDYYTPFLWRNLLKADLKGEALTEVKPLATLNRTQPRVQVVALEKQRGTHGFVTVQVRLLNQTSQTQSDKDKKRL